MCTHSIIHIPFQLLVLLPIAPLGAPRAGSRAVVVSIAVCQHFGVDQYYIFQDSTDRLEQLFGRLRMLQRSNRNFDAVGLVDRIIGIVAVQRFFDRNPHLDAGSNKLSGNIKDHVNPASWSGDTDPSTVNIGGIE